MQEDLRYTNLQHIMLSVSDMSLGDALDLLDSFDPAHAQGTIYNDSSQYEEYTFASLGNYYRNCWLPCNRIGPFWACTGPPGKKSFTLIYACQFVADILLREAMGNDKQLVYTRLAKLMKIGAP